MKRLLLFVALIAWSGMAGAVVYKWIDAQGKLQYGDRPPDGVHAEVVELLGTHVARAAAARESSAAASSSSPSSPRTAAAGSQDDATLKKSVEGDVEQTREKQCADAQDHYKKLIEGRRLYKTGANGERQYLTSDEIDAERVNAKRDLDAICNSPS
ncbi:MAG TPA: DUF4124 domain-containing protein [Steroidobacteraceae bacterium]|jgi:hypothetical protein|nr:DUF4124 domain-containing protein [Steroidobacteraceae bacterium]